MCSVWFLIRLNVGSRVFAASRNLNYECFPLNRITLELHAKNCWKVSTQGEPLKFLKNLFIVYKNILKTTLKAINLTNILMTVDRVGKNLLFSENPFLWLWALQKPANRKLMPKYLHSRVLWGFSDSRMFSGWYCNNFFREFDQQGYKTNL